MPEVSWDTAHAAIAEAVTNFFTLVLTPNDSAARAYIDSKYKYTSSLLSGQCCLSH